GAATLPGGNSRCETSRRGRVRARWSGRAHLLSGRRRRRSRHETRSRDVSLSRLWIEHLEHGPRLGKGFVVFGVGVAVGDDSAANLKARAISLDENRADSDIELARAAAAQIADRAGIDAAAIRFQLVDDLHGADLGRTC